MSFATSRAGAGVALAFSLALAIPTFVVGCYGPADERDGVEPDVAAPLPGGPSSSEGDGNTDAGGSSNEPPSVPTSPGRPGTEPPVSPPGGQNPPDETGNPPSQPSASGLPCDVEKVMQARCTSCHGNPLRAPMTLLTRADFLAASRVDPSVSVGARVVVRMADAARPMPPGSAPSVPLSEQATVLAWVEMGMPLGAVCTTPGEPPAPPDPAEEPPVTPPQPPSAPNPFDAPVQCSSGQFWRDGDDGSARMNPGRACISCHTRERLDGEDDAPDFIAAGTVYPTGHEPNLCLGTNGTTPPGVVVRLVDAVGREYRLPVNRSGNFMLRRRDARDFRMPFRASVLFAGRERAMGSPQMTGDCNGCHTVAGANGAPGRVVLP